MALSLYSYTERYLVSGGGTGLDWANAFGLAGTLRQIFVEKGVQ